MAIKSVDAKTLKDWLKRDEAILIDVREPAEHATNNIPCATLIPLSSFSTDKLPKTHGKKLVIHCHLGMRSMNICERIVAENPDIDVYNLEGGIVAWSKCGEDVEKSGKSCLPLDQQVQLSIGICIFLGSLLGYFVNPLFFLLSGFFGAGLIFAGLTGRCGLAIIIAKMPWNKFPYSCATK